MRGSRAVPPRPENHPLWTVVQYIMPRLFLLFIKLNLLVSLLLLFLYYLVGSFFEIMVIS